MIRPLGSTVPGSPVPQVPWDFGSIMGEKLPNSLYYLMVNGIISHKLPQALAKGEWMDKSQPLVDTKEFRELLMDLQDYRGRALGLLARHLHNGFEKKQIQWKVFWDPPSLRSIAGPTGQIPPDARVLSPKVKRGLRWR